jgi:hypothetical protein
MSCDKTKIIPFNFLSSVTTTWRLIEFVTWNDDDAIALDPLRMLITDLT